MLRSRAIDRLDYAQVGQPLLTRDDRRGAVRDTFGQGRWSSWAANWFFVGAGRLRGAVTPSLRIIIVWPLYWVAGSISIQPWVPITR